MFIDDVEWYCLDCDTVDDFVSVVLCDALSIVLLDCDDDVGDDE